MINSVYLLGYWRAKRLRSEFTPPPRLIEPVDA